MCSTGVDGVVSSVIFFLTVRWRNVFRSDWLGQLFGFAVHVVDRVKPDRCDVQRYGVMELCVDNC